MTMTAKKDFQESHFIFQSVPLREHCTSFNKSYALILGFFERS